MQVIAYYTDDDYRKESEKLSASLDRFGLNYDIRGVEDRGTWQANTSAKPWFVKSMMYEQSGPLLYLDADAVVQKPLKELEKLTLKDADIAVHYLGNRELLSGTIWLANNAACHELVNRWIEECDAHPRTWDQKCLQKVVSDMEFLRVRKLGPEYCCIFDISRRVHPGVDPVIEHFQASRRLKK